MKYWAFLFLWMLSGTLLAQSHHITYYQRSDGLPANLTKTTIQDNNGFIWVATDVGLARFDGRTFQTVLKELPSPYVKSFTKTKNGSILAITDGGLVTIKQAVSSVGVENFILSADSTNGINGLNYPKSAFEACNGDLWISEETSIARMRNGQFTSYRFDNTYSVNFLRSMHVWEQGCGQVVVALPTGGILFFNPEAEGFSPLRVDMNGHPLAKRLANSELQIHAATPIDNGHRVILATSEGIVVGRVDIGSRKFTIEEWALKHTATSHVAITPAGQVYACTFNNGVYWASELADLPNASPIKGLPFHVTNYAYPDQEGNVWINGDGGLALLQPQFFATVPVPENMRMIHYFIGEDEEVYAVDIQQRLFRLEGQHNNWKWKEIVKRVPTPSSDIFLSIQQKVAILNNTYYVADAGRITAHSPAGSKDIDLPTPIQPYILINADKAGNLWIDNLGDRGFETYRRRPNGMLTLFDHNIAGTKQPILTCIDRSRGKVYFSNYLLQQNYEKGIKDNYLLRYNAEKGLMEDLSKPMPPTVFEKKVVEVRFFSVAEDEAGTLWLPSAEGLYRIKDSLFQEVSLGSEYASQPVKYFLPDNRGGAWIALNVGLIYYHDGEIHEFSESDGLPTSNILHEGLKIDKEGRLWVATPAGIAYSQQSALNVGKTPKPMFTHLKVNGKVEALTNTRFEAKYNSYFEVAFVSPTYPNEKVLYRYRLNHREDVAWSEPQVGTSLLLPQLEDGDYQLEVQAKQQGNYEWSAPVQMVFYIRPIWYSTWWGIGTLLLGLACFVGLATVLLSASLRRQKKYLEKIVSQRTEEIQQQKEEISQQRDNLKSLNEELSETIALVNRQKEEIEAKSQSITDSINYASRIQAAMLPSAELMRDLLPEHFVLYRPRDIVSGDFYWCNRLEDGRVVLAVGDCTGHGVPGAFMSMIGAVLLEQVIMVKGEQKPECVLEDLSNAVKKALHQHETINQDGMDLAICLIDEANKKLYFAGAKNPIVYMQNGKAHRIKGVPAPIGGESNRYDSCYQAHAIDISSPTVFYLFSDGYQDQFGGDKGKKFMSANFRELLFSIHQMPMQQQYKRLQETFVEWMLADGRAYSQVDDVLVVGVKVGGQ